MIDASPRRLHVFKTVVDLGGFNAAAQHLGIAQPSVGAHVTALERQAGHTLLKRQRGMKPVLTDAGQAVYSLAVEVVRRSEQTAQILAELKSSRSREIVIAAHRDLALSFLPPRLERFTRMNARSRIISHIGTIEDVLAMVQSGTVQLGVLLAPGAIPGVSSEIVGREPLELVVGPSHPLAGRKRVSATELGRYAFVTGLRHSRYYAMTEKALRALGLETFQIALELQEAAAAREAIRRGRSIACLPRSTVMNDIAAGTLALVDTERRIEPLQIRCAYGASPSAAAARLLDALKRKD